MKRSEMRSTVRILIGETKQDFYRDTEINDCLYNGSIIIARDILANQTFGSIQTVAWNDPLLSPTDSRNEGRYGLPNDFMSLGDAQLLDGTVWYNEGQGFDRLSADKFRSVSRYVQGARPQYFKVERGSTSLSAGTPGDIWLWPYPDKVYTLRLSYRQKPTKMDDDEDICELDEAAHMLVCYHAAMIVSRKSKDRGVISEMASLYAAEKRDVLEYVGRMDLTGSIEVDDVYGG